MTEIVSTYAVAPAVAGLSRAPSNARLRARRLRAPLAVLVFGAFFAGVALTAMEGSFALLRVLWRESFVLGAVGGLLAAYVGWERRPLALILSLGIAAIGVTVWWATISAGLWQPPRYAVLWVPGLVALGAFAWRVARATCAARAIWLLRARDALVIPLGVALTPFMLLVSAQLVMVLDLHVLAFEDTLGPRFSQLSVSAFKANPWFAEVSLAAYFLLPAGIALAMAALERTRPPLDVLLTFAALTAVGYALYWVFPVVGPRQVFGAFPYAYPPAGGFDVRALELRLIAPRNGMPSLHTAWALMIWFVAAGAGAKLRLALRLFAALNIAATMGAEDSHWITDLIVAVPMTVAVCAATMLGTPLRGLRLAAIAVGGATTAAAMALLYAAIPVFQALPVLSWIFVAATVIPPLAINTALWRAALARRVRQEPRPSAAT